MISATRGCEGPRQGKRPRPVTGGTWQVPGKMVIQAGQRPMGRRLSSQRDGGFATGAIIAGKWPQCDSRWTSPHCAALHTWAGGAAGTIGQGNGTGRNTPSGAGPDVARGTGGRT